MLNAAVLLLDNQLRKSTDFLEITCGYGISHFQGNFQKIEQVIINVLQNACEAIEDKNKSIRISTGFDPESMLVWLKVSDEGQGIRCDDLPHVTDPFFTTKRTCGGTGLGLSISSRIMREHGGDMTFHSRQGAGTSVTLTFPAQHNGDATT